MGRSVYFKLLRATVLNLLLTFYLSKLHRYFLLLLNQYLVLIRSFCSECRKDTLACILCSIDPRIDHNKPPNLVSSLRQDHKYICQTVYLLSCCCLVLEELIKPSRFIVTDLCFAPWFNNFVSC